MSEIPVNLYADLIDENFDVIIEYDGILSSMDSMLKGLSIENKIKSAKIFFEKQKFRRYKSLHFTFHYTDFNTERIVKNEN